ncbi:MAG: glutamine synthetase family protein [Thermoplasmatales archaeon]
MELNPVEILKIVDQNDIRYFYFQFTDIRGTPKSVMIPRNRLQRVLEEGVLFDGSSILGYATIEESDMRAFPDYNSFEILPWAIDGGKAARLVCSIMTPDGKPFMGDPRYILQKQLEKLHNRGMEFFVGPEFEFFLLEQRDGKYVPHDSGGYFTFGPLDKGELVKKEILNYLEVLGYQPEAAHHEVSPGQHEIDLRYAPALAMADRIITMRTAIKTVAAKFGLYATFMPKPFYGINGTGMHIHQSIMTPSEDKNFFWDQNDKYGLSDFAYHYLAGVLKHSVEISSIIASWVNSYKRLVPGYEAPVYIAWGRKNRSAMIRIPAGEGIKKRLEFRAPDSSGNPYLQFAVILGAGLDGVDKKLECPDPVEQDIFKLTPKEREKMQIDQLPESLGEALHHLRNSTLMRDILGEHIYKNFLFIKQKEWDDFRSYVTDWEINNQLPIL